MRGYQALSRDINGRAACRAPMARCSPGLDLGRRAGVFCSRKLFGETTRRPRPRLLALALEHRQAGSGETVWQARFDSSSAWEVVLRSAFVPRTKLPHAVKLTLPPCPIYSGPEPRPETEGVVGRPSTADLVARGAAADATARLPSKLGVKQPQPPGGPLHPAPVAADRPRPQQLCDGERRCGVVAHLSARRHRVGGDYTFTSARWHVVLPG